MIPHNKEAEMKVLGTLMNNPASFKYIQPVLTVDELYTPEHKTIYQYILDAHAARKPYDIDNIMVYAMNKGANFDLILMDLSVDFVTESQLEPYIAAIKDTAKKRFLIQEATKLIQTIYDEKDHEQCLEKSQKIMYNMAKTDSHAITIRQAVRSSIENLNNQHKQSHLIPTKFNYLDDFIRGFEPGQFIVLAARPSMGKTALGLCIAKSILEQGIPVGFFSIEMTNEQMALRLVALEAQMTMDELYSHRLFENIPKFQQMTQAAASISEYPFFLDDQSRGMQQIRSQARTWVTDYGIKLMVIDYLGLIQSSKPRDNKVVEISDISAALKDMAKELRIPILVLCQLSRQVENRPDNHPRLSDLRDSGAIEQDADIIMFLYREHYYNKDADESIAELSISKNRNGKLGKLQLEFTPHLMRFK